jgi:hypothetical protein
MPDLIRCPKCERKLRLSDELIGKAVKCPTCGLMFTAPVGTPSEVTAVEPRGLPTLEPLREYADGLRETVVASTDERERWERVRKGLFLVLTSILTMIAVAVIVILGALQIAGAAGAKVKRLGQEQAAKEMGDSLIALGGLAVVGGLAAQLFGITGYGFCMGAPRRTGTRGLAAVAFTLAIGSLVLGILGAINTLVGGLGPQGGRAFPAGLQSLDALSLLANLAGVASLAVFLEFLRGTLHALEERSLARSVTYLMVLGAIVIVLTVAVVAAFGFAADQQVNNLAGGRRAAGRGMESTALAVMGLGLIDAVLALAWLVWYIVTLFQARGAIVLFLDRGLRPRAFPERLSR